MVDITVTGLTALAMKAYRNAMIVSASVRSNVLYLKRADGTELNAGAVGGVQGPPGDITVSPAYGDLTGNYPSPTIAAKVVTAAKIADQTITDAQVWPANKDGVATMPSMRTLGTGAQQAAAGNHTHAIPKIRSGVVAHIASAANTKTQVDYPNLWPSGFFTTIPQVTIAPDTGFPDAVPYFSVANRTLTGFSIIATRTTTSGTNYNYIASQQVD
jgi:hypothetical protein